MYPCFFHIIYGKHISCLIIIFECKCNEIIFTIKQYISTGYVDRIIIILLYLHIFILDAYIVGRRKVLCGYKH